MTRDSMSWVENQGPHNQLTALRLSHSRLIASATYRQTSLRRQRMSPDTNVTAGLVNCLTENSRVGGLPGGAAGGSATHADHSMLLVALLDSVVND